MNPARSKADPASDRPAGLDKPCRCPGLPEQARPEGSRGNQRHAARARINSRLTGRLTPARPVVATATRKLTSSGQGSHHALAERPLNPAQDRAAFEPPHSFKHGTQNSDARVAPNGRFEIVTMSRKGERQIFSPERVIGVDPLRAVSCHRPGREIPSNRDRLRPAQQSVVQHLWRGRPAARRVGSLDRAGHELEHDVRLLATIQPWRRIIALNRTATPPPWWKRAWAARSATARWQTMSNGSALVRNRPKAIPLSAT